MRYINIRLTNFTLRGCTTIVALFTSSDYFCRLN